MLRKKYWVMSELLYSVLMLSLIQASVTYAAQDRENIIRCRKDLEFECRNSKCIPKTWVCDSMDDCGDNSDEIPSECGAILVEPAVYLPPPSTCGAHYFTCENRDCVLQQFVCDGDDDCSDTSDEKNCQPSICSERQFSCSENKCIQSHWRCDGDKDCSDGSDEVGCDIKEINRCDDYEFACNGTTQCIYKDWVCDGDDDCSNGADEQNCKSVAVCDPSKEFRCNSSLCIPLSSVCNSIPDCPDAGDEQVYPCGSNECLINNGGCSQICIDLPQGFQCECRSGYKLINNQTCEDIDECLEPGSCSQFCVNEEGGFKCSCAAGYQIDSQNSTRCRASSDNASLIVVRPQNIKKITLNDQKREKILQNTTWAMGLDLDFKTGTIFWTDNNEDKIYKALIEGKNDKIIVIDSDFRRSDGLAVDWIYNRIYWTDYKKHTIELADYEGNMRKTVINDNLQKPRAIALDPLDGWMFWTDRSYHPRIERAGMDGSHRSIIVETDMKWPNGLTLDIILKKLYWVDGSLQYMATCNYDGSGRRLISQSLQFLRNPFSVTTFGDDIFWTNWDQGSISKAHKSTGEYPETIEYSKNDMLLNICVYHPSKQPGGINHCIANNAKCSHICLPAPRINSTSPLFTCACPDELRLSPDGLTCIENEISTKSRITATTTTTTIIEAEQGEELQTPESQTEISVSEQGTSLFNCTGQASNGISSDVVKLGQALQAAEQREMLYKSLLETNIQHNLEWAQKQEALYKKQIEIIQEARLNERRGISWLYKNVTLD